MYFQISGHLLYFGFNQKHLACWKTSDWQCWSHPQFQLTHHDTPLCPHHSLFTFTNLQSTATFSKKSSMSIIDKKNPKTNTFHIPSRHWNNLPGEDFVDTEIKSDKMSIKAVWDNLITESDVWCSLILKTNEGGMTPSLLILTFSHCIYCCWWDLGEKVKSLFVISQ